MSENKLLDLSFEFAVAIVNLVDGVTAPKSSYMTDQLARAGTSVGANIHEAQYAQSKKDFVAKLEIALKESNETSYWLKLMYDTKRFVVDLLLKLVPVPGLGFVLGFLAGILIQKIFSSLFNKNKTKRVQNKFYSSTEPLVKKKSTDVKGYITGFINSLGA